MTRSPILTLLAAATFASTALGQEVRQYREGDAVDPREVARMLGAPETPAPILYRSIRLLDQPAVQTKPAREETPPASVGSAATSSALPATQVATSGSLPALAPREPRAFALPVQFAFDSASILPDARSQLDAVAEGIKMLPAGHAIVIEGHTDATGSDTYNLQLSVRRAAAVKHYLVTVHGIDESRLRSRGFGENQPINERDPYAAENRRVQFRGS